MFTPWIKRKSLKGNYKSSKRLVVEGERPSLITLVALAGLMVVAGVFVVQKSWAALKDSVAAPTPAIVATPTPTPSPTPEP